MTARDGVPLAATVRAANQQDQRQLLPLLSRLPRVGCRRGRPVDRPRTVTTDTGSDSQSLRQRLLASGIIPYLPRRGDAKPLGERRWPVERTLSWMKQFRRLWIRWDRLSAIHGAFLQLARIIIAWRFLGT